MSISLYLLDLLSSYLMLNSSIINWSTKCFYLATRNIICFLNISWIRIIFKENSKTDVYITRTSLFFYRRGKIAFLAFVIIFDYKIMLPLFIACLILDNCLSSKLFPFMHFIILFWNQYTTKPTAKVFRYLVFLFSIVFLCRL